MLDLSVESAGEWLALNGVLRKDWRFRELGGGVSNHVILAESANWRAVLKQSLPKLRVEEEWLSDRGRIFREATAMRWLERKLRGGRIPRLLIEDRDRFAIAMEAASAGAVMWKDVLFAGQLEVGHARAAGEMLGSMISASYLDDEARAIFGDQTVFHQLRIDPYYRFTAERHPQFADYFGDLIARSRQRAVSLVHGDWSPKNLLIFGTEIWAIDWEVVHFGDPSFDVGFLLNHLLLKSIAMPAHRTALFRLAESFLCALRRELPAEGTWIEGAGREHLPALLLARVDGKSPAEYLDASMREKARSLAKSMMTDGPKSLEEIFTS